ncbi:MAG: DUF4393 domain-containing protein [Fusobacterium sp.]
MKKVLPEIYRDLVQPGAKQVGKVGETLGRAINCALLPLNKYIWKREEIEREIRESLEKKLKDTPIQNIQTPDIRVVGPTFDGLRYTAQEEELREMYTSLLANSMKRDCSKDIHPAFPEMIKQLEPDEARILEYLSYYPILLKIEVRATKKENSTYNIVVKNHSQLSYLKNIENKGKINNYLDNLVRLSIIEIPYGIKASSTSSEKEYNILKESQVVEELKQEIEKNSEKMTITEGIIDLTDLGKSFCKSCIIKEHYKIFEMDEL